MVIEACLFDLDGVLVNTAHYHFLAWKKLADKLGFVFTETDNERLKGLSRMDSLEILLEIGNLKLSEEDKNRFASEKNQVYLNLIQQMTPADVLPGSVTFLKELKNSGILTGLGSSSKNARLILEKTALLNLFDVIVDGNIIDKAKPNPEVFIIGAHLLGVREKNCLVFEDAIAGIQAAHRAGMKCVGIGSPKILNTADIVIPDLQNLSLNDLIIPEDN